MKLAGICPIGSLASYGYQHVYRECIATQAALCDDVYLIQSLDDPRNLDGLLRDFPNVVLVSDARSLSPDGLYDVEFSRQRAATDTEIVRAGGADVMILLSSNYYIPEHRIETLRGYCEEFYAGGEPLGWIYRGDQLAGQLFHASKRLPHLVRLDDYPETCISYVPDGARTGGKFLSVVAGDFAHMDPVALVDVPFEMTLAELDAKINYVRGYHDIMPKRPEVFEWEYWHAYYLAKFRGKCKSDEPLSPTGQALADLSDRHPEFVSHEILEAL